MKLKDYDYYLPAERIAQNAHTPRDGCRMMVIDEKLVHKKFSSIVQYLREGDVIVLNNTKVLEAKIYGRKITGSPAEILLTKKLSKDSYECHIKTKNPSVGAEILIGKSRAKIISQKNIDTFIIQIFGHPKKYLPGPPYIHKRMTSEYQTVFARNSGSLAAPTAGLHFTKRLLSKIKDKGIKIVFVTLHVGFGTFRNIDDLSTHKMSEEAYEIRKHTAAIINNRKGRLFVCGTTTLKALESSSKDGKIIPQKSSSELFIKPGHKFESGTDVLITNFHLPKSTLLLLTCAFGGRERIMDAYKQAINQGYMFYSLGDAMMVYKPIINS